MISVLPALNRAAAKKSTPEGRSRALVLNHVSTHFRNHSKDQNFSMAPMDEVFILLFIIASRLKFGADSGAWN